MTELLPNRREAGRLLALKLTVFANRSDVLVLALPRGGVPVAFEIAQSLNLPLDICLVRKLGVPDRRELAMGAIATGGVRIINQDVVDWLHISPQAIEKVATREEQELQRRDRAYRGDRPFPQLKDRTIILVDDGIATGSTVLAATSALRQQEPAQIVVAVPVAPPSVCEELQAVVDKVVCLRKPPQLHSISLWYEDFAQTSDEEVRQLLALSNRESVKYRTRVSMSVS